jgi:hypothetical protein
MALVGVALFYGEYREGASHAHTTHVVIAFVIFGIGCLIIAPALVGGAANKFITIIVDARKGGLRWTDPPEDAKPGTPVIAKPPEGAGDV